MNARKVLQEIIDNLSPNIEIACKCDHDETFPWVVFYYESRSYDVSLIFLDEWEIHIIQGYIGHLVVKLADPELMTKLYEYISDPRPHRPFGG